MKYYFYQPNINDEQCEIDDEEYKVLSGTIGEIVKILALLEKYNFVLNKYSDYEVCIYKETIDYMIYNQFSWDNNVTKIHNINSTLLNLFTSTKLYLEYYNSLLKKPYVENSNIYKKQISEQYDTVRGYFICEILRNYSQHKTMPLVGISIEGDRDDRKCFPHEVGVSSITMSPKISIEKLVCDFRINESKKNKLKNEFSAYENITPLVREYIKSIGELNILLCVDLDKYVEQLYQNSSKIFNKYDRDIKDLTYVIKKESEVLDSKDFFIEPFERYNFLRTKLLKLSFEKGIKIHN